MDASNAPIRRAPQELHTDDIKIAQKPVIETREDLADEIIIAPEVLMKGYAEALAFNEEPITIRIERTSEKNPPKVVDAWVNGKGAEVLHNGRWLELGFIPVGFPVTTKRKYAEVLAKAKIDTCNTNDDRDTTVEHPANLVARSTSSRAPFSVIEDRNPKGVAWLNGLVRFG